MTLLKELLYETRLSKSDASRIIATAPKRYKVYNIPKKSGGVRTIAHPARELKTLQRALVELSPEDLRVHRCATAYETGTSILENARKHATNNWIARLDFSNFFNSIRSEDWAQFLAIYDTANDYVELSKQVFFWRSNPRANDLCLSVGAPSSPFVSNRIMFQFDEAAMELSNEWGLTYSRYADDLSFSSVDHFNLDALKIALTARMPPYLQQMQFNERKSRINGPGTRKIVTGLIICEDGSITIGKKRRKLIESAVLKFLYSESSFSQDQLRGHLDFLKMIEPNAYDRIQRRLRRISPERFNLIGSATNEQF